MVTLAAGGRTGTRLHAALAQQFALVCDGKVTLTLPDSAYTLRQSDAVSLAAETPHQWENTGSSPARVLIVYTHAGASGGKTSP